MKRTNFGIVKVIIATFFILIAQQTYAASDINGIWKHSDKEAWLKVDAASGVASVYIHHHAKTAGLTVVKGIERDAESHALWVGKMYAAASDSFVNVELLLESPDCIIIIHNSNEILRLFRDNDLSR
jgi:ABC-type molybdate transport system ATPase subunit